MQVDFLEIEPEQYRYDELLGLDFDVPSPKERLDGIDTRLDRIDITLGLKPPKPKSAFAQFRQDIWGQVKAHKGTVISIAALLVGVGGWFGSGWFKYYLDHKDDDLNRTVDARIDSKEQSINRKLDEISKSSTKTEATLAVLEPFIHDLVRHEMDKRAVLSKQEFQLTLPQLNSTLKVAKQENVRVPAKLIQGLQQKLSGTDRNAAEYWPTVATFISYRSDLLSRQHSLNMPRCVDSKPTGMTINKVISPDEMTVNRGVYENCSLTLDSPEENERLNKILATERPLIALRHCLIRYHGGEVKLILAWKNRIVHYRVDAPPARSGEVSISGPSLLFEDCLFDFSVDGIPHPSGQKVTETLLAQNANTLELPRH